MNQLFLLSICLATILSCPDTPGCLQCEGAEGRKNCVRCFLGYPGADGKCVMVVGPQEVEKCATYRLATGSEQPECLECRPGFGFKIVDNVRTCVECAVSGCAICREFDQCVACQNSRLIRWENEAWVCSEEKVELPGCAVAGLPLNSNGQPTCHQCVEGQALQSDPHVTQEPSSTCQVTAISYCERLAVDVTDRCEVCRVGYYRLNNQGLCLRFSYLGSSSQLALTREYASIEGEPEKTKKRNAESPQPNPEISGGEVGNDVKGKEKKEEMELQTGPDTLQAQSQEPKIADSNSSEPEEEVIPVDQQDPQNPRERRGIPAHLRSVLILGGFMLLATAVSVGWLISKQEPDDDPFPKELSVDEP